MTPITNCSPGPVAFSTDSSLSHNRRLLPQYSWEILGQDLGALNLAGFRRGVKDKEEAKHKSR